MTKPGPGAPRRGGAGPGPPAAGAGAGPRAWARALVPVALVAGGAAAVWASGLREALTADGLARLTRWLDGLGAWGPVAYVAGYVLLKLVFVPALPLTLLGGLAFGPALGTAYVSLAATLGAAAAFLVARHALRGLVEGWVARSPRLARIDALVAEHGWRILAVTRLVPLFPYNLQNYAYGLTRLRFWPYVLVSWVCMLPATVAYTLAGSALGEGGRDPRRMAAYLGAAGVLLVLVSLLPRWLARRSAAAGAVLRDR